MEVAVRWSPYSTDDRRRFLVVDAGNPSLTLNQVDSFPGRRERQINYHAIAHYSKIPSFAAFDWSKTDESIVGLGLNNGSADIVRLRSHEDGGSESIATFKIKQQRKSNSIAFSTQGWLALGLDKARSDVCLVVYDVNRGDEAEPVKRLCVAEQVSSVRFFPSRPQEVVAGTQRAHVKLFDLRDDHAGSTASLQAPTRNVNDIAIDPLDENYFASAGSTDDPGVTVWDRRNMSSSPSASSTGSGAGTGAVFEFKTAVDNFVKTTIWSLRYSGERRGRLAVCSSTGELKVIDMSEAPFPAVHSPDRSNAGSSSADCYVSESRSLEQPYHDERYGRGPKERIVAFDWVQGQSNIAQPVITVRPNRAVDVVYVPVAKPVATITPRKDLSIALEDLTITEPALGFKPDQYPSASSREQANGILPKDFESLEYGNGSDARPGSESDALGTCDRDSPRLAKLLESGTVQRERCKRGYLFDAVKNIELVKGNFQLERLWEIINRFNTQATNDGMIWGNLDLSYIGISGLWSENVGPVPQRRFSHSPAKPSKAIIGLTFARAIPAFEGERTHFPEHRQLCLAICGWKFTTDTLEAECQELIERGLYYQAIVQAVLHDYKHIALNLLRTLIRSKTIQNIGLGALLASDDINEEQREMCMWMAADTEDPALKALLTFLTTGNWRDVMKTNYLHLGYRLALGLKYLNDTELSGFIQSETARAVKNGDLEGVLLTGLTEQSMDLFQTYITKTNDLQTAVLATAVTNPKFVDDVRWEMWRETYFMLMQGWKCLISRTRFTVQHNRMARARDGQSLIEAPKSGLELKCLHCQNAYGSAKHRSMNSGDVGGNNVTRVSGPAANDGTVCLNCGRHMPRCGLCAQWLGTPRNPPPSTTPPFRPSSASTRQSSGDQLNNATRSVAEGVAGNTDGPATATPEQRTDEVDDIMAKLLTFCMRCRHGFHADHARMWFAKWDICPVPDCSCRCGFK